MSQVLSSVQHICSRKTLGSNMGALNLFLAAGAIWPWYAPGCSVCNQRFVHCSGSCVVTSLICIAVSHARSLRSSSVSKNFYQIQGDINASRSIPVALLLQPYLAIIRSVRPRVNTAIIKSLRCMQLPVAIAIFHCAHCPSVLWTHSVLCSKGINMMFVYGVVVELSADQAVQRL